MKKRLGIFLFFNPEGKVYEYVEYLLASMLECLDDLVIVCNGFISAEGREKLGRYASHITIRPNEGFDFLAWKEGIFETCGIDEVRGYDELVLFNDSFFGPLYPMADVFRNMDEQAGVDLWGLSSHGAVARSRKGTGRPAYLQTYFLVFRSKLLHSGDFESYWRNLEPCSTFNEHVEKVASQFTDHFAKLGYKWTAYASTFDLESGNGEKNLSHHMYNSYEMIARRGLPIIKRKTFIMGLESFLRYSDGSTLPETMRYIDEETDYDTGLIWDYLLDNCYLEDLSHTLGLTRILPTSRNAVAQREQRPVRAAVIMHLYYEDLFDKALDTLAQVPQRLDIYVTTSSEDKAESIREKARARAISNLSVRVVENRGRDVSALLVGCRDVVRRYDYICYTHDKKASYTQNAQSGRAFAQLLMDGVLASTGYIEGILDLFERNPRLGLAVPPRPHHSSYFRRLPTRYWTICYEQTNAVLSRLGLSVPMSSTKDCMAIGTVFWCRTAALAPLFEENWAVDDFLDEPFPSDGSISHGLERSFPFIAQSQGYYTVEVLPDTLGVTEVEDFRYMLDEALGAVAANRNIPADTSNLGAFTKTVEAIADEHLVPRRKVAARKAYHTVARAFPGVKKLRKGLTNPGTVLRHNRRK